MGVGDEIRDGESVEMGVEMKGEGKFGGRVYRVRYLEGEGKGSVKMEEGRVVKGNEGYVVKEWKLGV